MWDENFPSAPGAGAGGAEEELYRCYVRYMNDARRVMVPLLTNRRRRRRFLEIHRIMSPQQFRECLSSIADEPQRRKAFEKTLRAGFAEEPSPEEWAAWRRRVG
jgi:hypothetical protein